MYVLLLGGWTGGTHFCFSSLSCCVLLTMARQSYPRLSFRLCPNKHLWVTSVPFHNDPWWQVPVLAHFR